MNRYAALLGLTAALASPLSGCKPKRPQPEQSASIQFEELPASAGLRFTHFTGADGRYYMPESIGSGAAFLDYDGDGRLDLFFANCTGWPDRKTGSATPALFRNEPDGRFREVTRDAGLAHPFFALGVSVGDFDNDGHDDLVLTGLRGNRLYRNTRRGGFTDVTRGSGLDRTLPWGYHTGAAWFDYDRDGLLDLFICRYVEWSPETDVPCRSSSGKRIYCGPNRYSPTRSLLYRNVGGGKFQDVSVPTGIAGVTGKGLGVLPLDVNDDGWTDLVVTNDTTPNHLFLNLGGKRFREAADELGVAVDDNGRARAGMGIDAADVRNDGGLALSIGNFAHEGLSLYDRRGSLFMDAGGASGLVAPTLPHVTFGVSFLDADRDGWTDLFIYNGHVDPEAAESGGAVTYRQRPQLFRNHGGRFTEVGANAGPVFSAPQLGRGCAAGDFDNDGRPDLLLSENGGPGRLLRNATKDTSHWIGLRLAGTRSNRNAYGSEVRVTAAGGTQRRWVHSGGSYLSHGDTRALFGLGTAASVEKIEVKWPSGRTTVLTSPPIDRYLEVTEPR